MNKLLLSLAALTATLILSCSAVIDPAPSTTLEASSRSIAAPIQLATAKTFSQTWSSGIRRLCSSELLKYRISLRKKLFRFFTVLTVLIGK
jgi:hypothetical protein